MKLSNLNKQYAGRIFTRHVDVGLPRWGSCTLWAKSGLRLKYLTSITIAILLLASISTVHAGSLGRLFFTPEQRAQLDFVYTRDASANGNASPVLTVNGIVQKNGGARTVWVNGVAQSAANSRERTPTAQTVAVPGSHPVKLKVGEKILLDQPVSASPNTADN